MATYSVNAGMFVFWHYGELHTVYEAVSKQGLFGLHNMSAMVSATLCGILIRRIMIHANVNRFLACVNRVWLQAARAVTCEFGREFLRVQK